MSKQQAKTQTFNVHVRAHTVPMEKAKPDKWPTRNTKYHPRWAKYDVVIDCETRIDLGQQLTFGVFRVGELRRDGQYHCIEDGLFYADDLPMNDRKVLEEYRTTAVSDVPCFPPRFPLYSLSEFIQRVFFKYAHKGALMVGHNLMFDLARIATEWREGSKNEWSLILSKYASGKENLHNPRILIEPLDSKKAFIRFQREWKCGSPTQISDARFLDTRMLLWALFNQSYSLKRACDNEKGPFKGQNLSQKIDHEPTGKATVAEIKYAIQDGRCTEALLNACKREFDLHKALDLDPDRAYSPATFAKKVLDVMGIKQPATKFEVPDGILNVAMESYAGGRSETKLRLEEVPCVPVDLVSEYPSTCVLLGLWNILTAESLSFPDGTREVQEMLEHISLSRCFDPQAWRKFAFWALIIPDDTLLPLRGMYNGVTQNIANNFLSANPQNPQAQWVAGPDLVADVIRTGKIPRILEAIRIVPVGKQKGMRPVNLRGMVEIDPYKHDLFKRVIELRKSKSTPKDLAYWLKIFANAMYGFFAEVNPQNVSPLRVKVFKGKDGSYPHMPKKKNPRDKVVTIEKQGQWYAPYLASLITSGGRLLVAMLEQCAVERQSSWLYADTDAVAYLASEHGGSLDHIPGCKGKRLLTYAEVDSIVERFNLLNPYDRTCVPDFLNLTDDNFVDPKTKTQRRHLLGLSVRTKAYCLYERGGDQITVINPKGHGLGHLYPPLESPKGWDDSHSAPKWIYEAWEWMLRNTLGLKQIDLPWLKYPLMMREAVTTCNLLHGLHQWNKFRPMNFFMRPVLYIFNGGYGETMLSLVCPFEKDARKWSNAVCFNTADPSDTQQYTITTSMRDVIKHPERIVVKNFETLLRDYLRHPESKSLGPDGKPCKPDTHGLLQRMHVTAGEIIRIGKESPRGLDEQDEPSEIMEFEVTKYTDCKEKTPGKGMVQPTITHFNHLRKLGKRRLISAGCSERFLHKIRHRHFVREIALRDFERTVRECRRAD